MTEKSDALDATATLKGNAVRFRRKTICSFIGVFCGIAIMAPIMIMLLDRREPITIHEGWMEPSEVRPGQVVTIVWRATEHRLCDGNLERRVLDAARKIHTFLREPTVYHVYGPQGGILEFRKQFTIPLGIAQGVAIYDVRGERWCNVLQKHIWSMPFQNPLIPFTVIRAIEKD